VHEAEPDSDADLEVKAALQRARRPASSSHDAVIFAAAEAASGKIRSRPKPRRWLVPASLAAGLAGVVVWSVLIRQPAPPAMDSLRGGAAGELIIARAPLDGAVLDHAPTEFAWEAAEITGCTIELRDSQALVLWRSEPVDASRLELPETARAALSTPGSYYWRVECRAAADVRVGGPFRFELRQTS
jgi:xanthosine utilization system XapX-like protein